MYRLRKKYEDEWKEHKRNRDGMMLALWKAAKVTAVLVVAAGSALLLYLVMRPRKDEARPVDDFPPLGPVPTASAAPPDIADPTQPSAVPTTRRCRRARSRSRQGGTRREGRSFFSGSPGLLVPRHTVLIGLEPRLRPFYPTPPAPRPASTRRSLHTLPERGERER